MLADGEFEAQLADSELIEKYRGGCRNIDREVAAEFERNRTDLQNLRLSGMETERTHRDLLNLAVFPFTERGLGADLNYRFLYGSPLSELDVSNFDFLIARMVPADKPIILVPGEGKSSLGHPERIVKEIIEKRRVLEENMPYVLENYLGQSATRQVIIEPVLMVDSVDSTAALSAAIAQGAELKVWHGPSTGKETLSIASPPSGTPNRHTFLHREPALNKMLDKTPTVRKTFDIWPKTHSLLQLAALLSASSPSRSENSMAVSEHQLEAVLEHDLFYLSASERTTLARKLLEDGERIGFLTAADALGERRIVAKGLKRNLLEQTLREKWLRAQLKRDQSDEVDKRKEKLQAELAAQRSKVKTLRDWM